MQYAGLPTLGWAKANHRCAGRIPGDPETHLILRGVSLGREVIRFYTIKRTRKELFEFRVLTCALEMKWRPLSLYAASRQVSIFLELS